MNNNNQPANYADNDEIDLRDIFKTLGKWKRTIFGFTIGAMLLAGIGSFFILTPIYEARTVIRGAQMKNLGTSNSVNYILKEEQDYHEINKNTLSMPINVIGTENYTELIMSPWIINNTIDKLNLDMTAEELHAIISAEKTEEGTSLEIKVSYKEPVLAANIANTLVKQLQIYINTTERQQIDRVYRVLEKEQTVAQADLDESLTQYADFQMQQSAQSTPDSIATKVEATKLQNTIDRKSDVVDLLNSRTLELKLTRSFIESEDSIIVLSQATEPESPVSPNKKLNVAIAGVLALMVSVFGVFLLEYLREDQQI